MQGSNFRLWSCDPTLRKSWRSVAGILGVALGVGFFVADFNVGAGWQCNGGRDSGSGDDGEEIEVHGGIPRIQLACLPGGAVKQT